MGEAACLANVAAIPGHKNTTLAIARPLSLYPNGLPPYSLNSLIAVALSAPVTYALCIATITVSPSAADRVSKQASTDQTRQAILTEVDSCRSGQKRLEKKALPKIVAA